MKVSKPVLSVVGGTLVLGKPFQVLCHSENGSLPITYTLFSPNGPADPQVVENQGQLAVFNVSALYKTSDMSKLLCHAKNSRHGTVIAETLRYTKIIGMLGTKARGNFFFFLIFV